MKKLSAALILIAASSFAMTASAVPWWLQSASSCYQNGMTPVGAGLRNLSGGNQSVVCSLDLDGNYTKIDQIVVATNTVGPGMCSLRDSSGNIIYANTKSGDFYTWTTDRNVSGTGYSIHCTITVDKSLWWMQTHFKN